jgi:hypothetical protein
LRNLADIVFRDGYKMRPRICSFISLRAVTWCVLCRLTLPPMSVLSAVWFPQVPPPVSMRRASCVMATRAGKKCNLAALQQESHSLECTGLPITPMLPVSELPSHASTATYPPLVQRTVAKNNSCKNLVLNFPGLTRTCAFFLAGSSARVC